MPRLHPTPDEAATKIQATFRGYSVRKHIQREEDHSNELPKVTLLTNPDPNLAATKIQATFRGYLTRKELNLIPKEHSDKTLDSEKLSPTFANLRLGKEERYGRGLSDISNKSVLQTVEDEEERRNLAATRIQAAFRGYQVRSHLTQVERSGDSSPCYGHHLSECEAATKIQAAFRGYRVRKNMRAQTAPIPRHEGQKSDEAKYRDFVTRREVGGPQHRMRAEKS